jgi:hypothetical protein
LVRSKHFVTESLYLAHGAQIRPLAEECQLWICLEGAGRIGDAPVRRGEVWLLPESEPQPLVRADGPARFLRTYVPGT